jgi:hypothetical protein
MATYILCYSDIIVFLRSYINGGYVRFLHIQFQAHGLKIPHQLTSRIGRY